MRICSRSPRAEAYRSCAAEEGGGRASWVSISPGAGAGVAAPGGALGGKCGGGAVAALARGGRVAVSGGAAAVPAARQNSRKAATVRFMQSDHGKEEALSCHRIAGPRAR